MPPKPKQRAIVKASKPSKSTIPSPFTPAPAELSSLLSTFSRDTVYITHIDTHPAWFKKRIFSVPVILNLAITLILALRAYYILPYYARIILSVMGNLNETTIYWTQETWGSMAWKVFKRMLSFMLDFLLFRIVGPWPWSFFLELPGNPVWWRWKVGFRDQEVVIRQSRGWGGQDLLGLEEGSSGKAGEDSPFFKTRILPALDEARLREKTGYLLMDADFDLDFYGMIAATQLVDRKTVTMDKLRKAVFVYVGDLKAEVENGQWAMWDCSEAEGEESETEARNKLMAFKDKLTAMGKESLFFKWVELVQFESNAPGGFTQEKQAETAEKTKKMFEAEGVDWEAFSTFIGGGNMPGM
ncbi:hypothetical protein HBI75_036210 [Parastagonospora nodorum]|nr:hypothetical protein HBI06_087010 [Parastagonospora nodorum]KAH4245583.1 hypothetical protein HBI05_070140 [Parastagonospora nodorum]KAH5042224.1 hypothetical protein HBI75_036210 [Parastagonospora nodorum]KAH5099280.1 hypothetical protein HBH72_109540 [Parastagonospora nodorum]KAH5436974.1 hypothetical protein HBI47_068840 [Parastagonospora nodorum]